MLHFLGLQRRNLSIDAFPDSQRHAEVKEKKAGDSGRGTARRPSKLERTAYHEAGHAVAAYDQRRRISRVSIIPDFEEGTLGHCSYSQFWKDFHPDINDDSKTRGHIETAIICCLSGHTAEARLSGRNNWVGSSQDRSAALGLALYIAPGGGKELQHYYNWMWERTKGLLAKPFYWDAIEALAAELLQRRDIGGQKARRIIHEAIERALERKISGRSKT